MTKTNVIVTLVQTFKKLYSRVEHKQSKSIHKSRGVNFDNKTPTYRTIQNDTACEVKVMSYKNKFYSSYELYSVFVHTMY